MTRYDFFRRRIAPVAFVLALGLMAYDMCNKHERTHVTFVIEYGEATRDVRAVDAEIWMNGERVSYFRREAQPGALIGKTQFEASLPDTSGELRVEVDLATGERRNVTRQLHVNEGQTVRFDLERDLR